MGTAPVTPVTSSAAPVATATVVPVTSYAAPVATATLAPVVAPATTYAAPVATATLAPVMAPASINAAPMATATVAPVTSSAVAPPLDVECVAVPAEDVNDDDDVTLPMPGDEVNDDSMDEYIDDDEIELEEDLCAACCENPAMSEYGLPLCRLCMDLEGQ